MNLNNLVDIVLWSFILSLIITVILMLIVMCVIMYKYLGPIIGLP